MRRRAVEDAMRRAEVTRPRARARAMYAALGRGLLELLWLAGAPPAAFQRAVRERVRVTERAERALDAALARGSVILGVSHTGNWELAACSAAALLARRGRRLAVVAKPLSVRAIDAFVGALRARAGLIVLRPAGAAREAARAMARGDVVAMPIDQVPDRARHAEPVSFLGAAAPCDRAPFALAARSRATVLVVAARWVGDGAHAIDVLDAIAPPGATPRAWVRDAAVRATGALEAFVLGHPSSWLWLHRRWRTPDPRRLSRRAIRANPPEMDEARVVAGRGFEGVLGSSATEGRIG